VKEAIETLTNESFAGPGDDVTRLVFLKKRGFLFLGAIGDLFESGLPALDELKSCGVYAVTIPDDYKVAFVPPDAAVKRGNVLRPWSMENLRAKWVEGVDVVYYGLAGWRSFRSLRRRLRSLMRHGTGKTTTNGPHKGGEILWQLVGCETFGVWAYPTGGPPVPRVIEHELLECFHRKAGKLPFANRQS